MVNAMNWTQDPAREAVARIHGPAGVSAAGGWPGRVRTSANPRPGNMGATSAQINTRRLEGRQRKDARGQIHSRNRGRCREDGNRGGAWQGEGEGGKDSTGVQD